MFVPETKNGNLDAARYVLEEMDISVEHDLADDVTTVWGKADGSDDAVTLVQDTISVEQVPNLKGMGARDAVYLLESRGLKVTVEGVGNVVGQSLPPYSNYQKGETIHIRLKR